MPHPLSTQLLDALAALADPDRAQQQQAYMKSAMPFYGVTTPVLRKTARGVFADHPLVDAAAWRDATRELWHKAKHREERYAAIELMAWPRYQRRFLDLDALPLIREMIISGAWWDFVDALAIGQVGTLLKGENARMTETLRTWSYDDNLWIRRSAILAQLKFKEDTDLALLFDAIEGSIEDQNFFARKAIGWALRELSKTMPALVATYVRDNESRLSPLSQREALKVLKRQRRYSTRTT